MNKEQIAAQPVDDTIEGLNDLIVDCIQDIKGKRIIKLDLRELDDRPTDFFIICEGDSTVQVKSIAENIKKRIYAEMNILPGHYEGQIGASWILVDYFNVVVHVFYHETREHYELEELWNDAKSTEYEDD